MGVEIARPPLTAPGRGRRSAASPQESSLPTPYAPRRAPKPGREHRLETAYHEQTPLTPRPSPLTTHTAAPYPPPPAPAPSSNPANTHP